MSITSRRWRLTVILCHWQCAGFLVRFSFCVRKKRAQPASSTGIQKWWGRVAMQKPTPGGEEGVCGGSSCLRLDLLFFCWTKVTQLPFSDHNCALRPVKVTRVTQAHNSWGVLYTAENRGASDQRKEGKWPASRLLVDSIVSEPTLLPWKKSQSP